MLEKKKQRAIFSIIASALLISCFIGGSVIGQETDVVESSIGAMVITALVGVVIAVALLPIIANQTATLENDTNLDTSEQTLVGLWPLLIIVGVMMAIIGFAL